MKIWVISWVVLALLGMSSVAMADMRFRNDRYGYAIVLPDIFSDLTESDNGDGGVATSADGLSELRVFGAQILDGSFSDEVGRRLASDKKDGWAISYVSAKPKHASYSGSKGDRILYVRMVPGCAGTAILFQVEYPAMQLKSFNSVIQGLVTSLKANANGC